LWQAYNIDWLSVKKSSDGIVARCEKPQAEDMAALVTNDAFMVGLAEPGR
jgi:hypothetical protein